MSPVQSKLAAKFAYENLYVEEGLAFEDSFSISKNFSNSYRLFSLLVDILVTTILLVILLIVAPVIWVLNLILSPGPLFYTQTRVGKNGRTFKIYKFRSMIVEAEADGKARFASSEDPRITKVGAFLRKVRLDEIPQVINVCKGEMTVIGPRPERPEFVATFIKEHPSYNLRHLVKPGITGWAQVKYKYTNTIEDGITKSKYDLDFIQNRSFRMDVEIIGGTISTIAGFLGM